MNAPASGDRLDVKPPVRTGGRDPVILARRMGIEPDPWQARLLRSTAPRIALNIARQVGKSTAAGILASHTAIYEPGSLTLLLSPSTFDFRQPVRVVANGRTVFEARVQPSVATLLKWAAHDNDRTMLFGAELNVDLTK